MPRERKKYERSPEFKLEARNRCISQLKESAKKAGGLNWRIIEEYGPGRTSVFRNVAKNWKDITVIIGCEWIRRKNESPVRFDFSNQKRNQAIKEKLLAGARLQEVADELGFSRQRIKQIADRMGLVLRYVEKHNH